MRTNRNRYGAFILLLALVVASAPVLAQGSLKIGVVDMETVLLECNMGKALQADLENYQKTVENEGKPMADKMRSLQQELQDKGATLSQAKISDLRRQIEDQKILLQRFQSDKQQEFEAKKSKGLLEIEKKLKPVMESIRDSDGFDMIFHKPGVVIIAKESYNITKLVIDRLNAAN